ncbi:MAG: hypothetical protein KatS3mg011_1882 [Acidimicrobiia bacterium]|nr:MAG: hypothetical protein KatS3mg011_1882 [Acidimicrobiia bacterium]
MRTTIFRLDGSRVVPEVRQTPDWQPYAEYEGQRLDGVRLFELLAVPSAELQLVEIAAGGGFVMHSSPDIAFCQVVRGRGKLGLPGGTALEYQGPELYVFLPGTLHDWHEIEEDTLLAVCLVKQM